MKKARELVFIFLGRAKYNYALGTDAGNERAETYLASAQEVAHEFRLDYSALLKEFKSL